jgi:hypothetical protein
LIFVLAINKNTSDKKEKVDDKVLNFDGLKVKNNPGKEK